MQTPIRVLVVDDDLDVAKGTCRVLDRAGYVTTMVHTVAGARDVVTAFLPDLVLLDRGLPDGDGLDVCRWIKAAPDLADVFVIIASAVYAAQDDQLAGLESGADGSLLRPVTNRELLTRVEAFARIARVTRALRTEVARRRQLEEQLESRVETAVTTAGGLRRGTETILVVEDEAAILGLVRTLLERLGYSVVTAATPREAIALAKADGHHIDLLVTDVVMPEMNGRMLAAELTALHPHLKTLYMSGYAPNVLAPHGVVADGPNFIEKPFAMSAFAARLRSAIDGH